jgi:thiol-disulfide isomerase/thioredoxin
MDSRIRERAGRIVWRLPIFVAAMAAVGLLLVVALVVLHPRTHFLPGGTYVGSDSPTFAATVGSTVPDVTGRRLDGTEDSLLAYRGRVVLIDFWATWCAPCVNTLPTLRELVAEIPADRFTLLSISVDDDRETVTRFMEDEPMPWANWYAGPGRDSIARAWGIRGFPTYVLVNDQGLVLARTLVFTPWLVSTLKRAVEAAPEPEDRGAVE